MNKSFKEKHLEKKQTLVIRQAKGRNGKILRRISKDQTEKNLIKKQQQQQKTCINVTSYLPKSSHVVCQNPFIHDCLTVIWQIIYERNLGPFESTKSAANKSKEDPTHILFIYLFIYLSFLYVTYKQMTSLREDRWRHS